MFHHVVMQGVSSEDHPRVCVTWASPRGKSGFLSLEPTIVCFIGNFLLMQVELYWIQALLLLVIIFWGINILPHIGSAPESQSRCSIVLVLGWGDRNELFAWLWFMLVLYKYIVQPCSLLIYSCYYNDGYLFLLLLPFSFGVKLQLIYKIIIGEFDQHCWRK